MSKRSVLEPPEKEKPKNKPLQGRYMLDIPYGCISIMITPEGLVMDIGQTNITPKKKDG